MHTRVSSSVTPGLHYSLDYLPFIWHSCYQSSGSIVSVSMSDASLVWYHAMFVIIKLTNCTCFLTPCIYVTEYYLHKWKQQLTKTSLRWSANRDTYFVNTMTIWLIWGLCMRSSVFFNESTLLNMCHLQTEEDSLPQVDPASQYPSPSSSLSWSAMLECPSGTDMTGLL